MRMWCCRGTRATNCPVAEHPVGFVSRMRPPDAMALHDSLNLLVAIRSCPWVPESQNVMHCTLFSAVREFLFVRLQTKVCHHRMRRLPRAQPHPRCPRSELQHLGLGHVRRAFGRSSPWTRHSRTRFIRTRLTMLIRRPTRGVHFCEACVSRAPQRRRASSPWGVSRQAPCLACTRRSGTGAGAGTGRYRCRSGSGAGIRC